MSKILSIATYPIERPQHGGQKRIDAITTEYRNAGIESRFVAIYHDMFYQDAGQHDIALRGESFREVLNSPFTGDVVSGEAIYSDPMVKERIIAIINDFKPDFIDIHQAFPYLGLEPLLAEMKLDIPLIFNSHNIEYLMKQEMLEGLGWGAAQIDEVVRKIKGCEQKLAKKAKLTTAVSDDDAKELKKLGAGQVIISPNGINKINASKEDTDYWMQHFDAFGVHKVALFVGSAHPPNWFGFKDMVGLGLGFLGRDERMVFAGSVSEYIESEVNKIKLDPAATVFWERAVAAGRLSQERLEGLINFADTIILPITEGGGSNLKTAEAIASGKKIVATTYAFRGFENLKTLPNVYIADDPDDFVSTIRKVLSTDLSKRNTEEQLRAETVLWHNCLKEFISRVRSL